MLDGNTYSMEGHLVHYNSKYKNFQEAVDKPDGLAVTGFFFQAAGDKDCVGFKKISDGIERIEKPNSKARLAADCLSFLELQELNKHYYRYACHSRFSITHTSLLNKHFCNQFFSAIVDR